MNRDIPASRAILDTNAAMRQAIERANHAVIEVVRTGVKFGDPLLETVLGVDRHVLEALAGADKRMIHTLCMTAVPVFSIRLAGQEFVPMLKGEGGVDAALQLMLRNFPSNLPIRSL